MSHPLFTEIKNFKDWVKDNFKSQENNPIEGEWEFCYTEWQKIYDYFSDFIETTDSQGWSSIEKDQVLYIIARDNETQRLASILNEKQLMVLTQHSINRGTRNDKWQLAIQLHKLSDKKIAIRFLEKFVNDDEEYVNRRALMELAKLGYEKTDAYSELFWNRNIYGEMSVYQKLAALESLRQINSSLLKKYIELAKQDGSEYLLNSALIIEKEQNQTNRGI